MPTFLASIYCFLKIQCLKKINIFQEKVVESSSYHVRTKVVPCSCNVRDTNASVPFPFCLHMHEYGANTKHIKTGNEAVHIRHHPRPAKGFPRKNKAG